MGPAWECLPERLANGRVVYRCNGGHFHSDPSAAWACGPDAQSTESGDVMKCKHCGRPIRAGEAGVNAGWIHEIGFYQCPGSWGEGVLAEPETGVPQPTDL